MPPDFEWVLVADTLTSADNDYRYGHSVAFDALGYCYAAGTFSSAVRFGSTNVTAT